MSPINLTRRGLVSGFLAFLLGLLWPGKRSKDQTPSPSVESAPASSWATISTYDADGDLICIKQADVRPTQTVYTYDARNRLVKLSDG